LGRHWTADIDGVVVVPAACVGDVAEAARRLLDAPALEAACLKYID
jgi:regulator of RNase E activity RraA